MVQTKKFQQSFLNEYLACNLHEQDVLERGKIEGLKKGRMEIAKNLLALGLPIETIIKATGLSREEIEL